MGEEIEMLFVESVSELTTSYINSRQAIPHVPTNHTGIVSFNIKSYWKQLARILVFENYCISPPPKITFFPLPQYANNYNKNAHTYTLLHTRTRTHASAHSHLHSHLHTRTCTLAPAHSHLHTRTCTLAPALAHPHIHTRTPTPAHTPTHSHTHTLSFAFFALIHLFYPFHQSGSARIHYILLFFKTIMSSNVLFARLFSHFGRWKTISWPFILSVLQRCNPCLSPFRLWKWHFPLTMLANMDRLKLLYFLNILPLSTLFFHIVTFYPFPHLSV